MNRRDFLKGTALAGLLPGLIRFLPIPAKEPGRLIEPARVDWEDGWCALTRHVCRPYKGEFSTRLQYKGSANRIRSLWGLLCHKFDPHEISGCLTHEQDHQLVEGGEDCAFIATFNSRYVLDVSVAGAYMVRLGTIPKGEIGIKDLFS